MQNLFVEVNSRTVERVMNLRNLRQCSIARNGSAANGEIQRVRRHLPALLCRVAFGADQRSDRSHGRNWTPNGMLLVPDAIQPAHGGQLISLQIVFVHHPTTPQQGLPGFADGSESY